MKEIDVKVLRKKLNLTQQELADRLGVSRNTVVNYERGETIPESKRPILRRMLEGGETKNDNFSTEHYVFLLPLSAQGGSLGEFSQSVKEEDCERIKSPIDGADFAVPISGDSMAPEFPNGSRVLVKKIDDSAFIEWGRAYVLDTCNGSVIKIVTPSKREGYLTCSSLNSDPRYAPFDVNVKDIYGVYRILLCMALK